MMNHFRKQAALRQFSGMAPTMTVGEMETFIRESPMEKPYTDEEIKEILGSMDGFATETQDQQEPEFANQDKTLDEQEREAQNKVQRSNNRGTLIAFEEFQVEQIVENVLVMGEGYKKSITGYRKKGNRIRVTNIEQSHADRLNSQVRTSGKWYFAPGDGDVVDLRTVFELGG